MLQRAIGVSESGVDVGKHDFSVRIGSIQVDSSLQMREGLRFGSHGLFQGTHNCVRLPPIRNELDDISSLLQQGPWTASVFGNAENSCGDKKERPLPTCRQPCKRASNGRCSLRNRLTISNANVLPEIFLSHLPDEAIEIEVQEG